MTHFLGKLELISQRQRTLHPPGGVEGEFSRTFKTSLREKKGEVLEAKVITKNGEMKDVEIKTGPFGYRGKSLIQGTF